MKDPRSVIVKTMVTKKDSKTTFDFFKNVKNWESGGALKNIKRVGEWWHADAPFGEAKIRLRDDEKFGILDHEFVGGGGNWTVFGRVTPNESGSTMLWQFIRPELQEDFPTTDGMAGIEQHFRDARPDEARSFTD